MTVQVQEAFSKYFNSFGIKVVEFDNQVTVFKSLKTLVPDWSYSKASKGESKIVITLSLDGEYFNFNLIYQNDKLVSAGLQVENSQD